MYIKEQLISNKRRLFFIALCLVWGLITILFRNIPFFWDSAHFSEQANYFYYRGFEGFITSKGTDTGMFPLFAVYLTLGWKLLGRTLLVSHLLMLPFLIGISWEFLKLLSRYVSPKVYIYGVLFLLADPVIVTQAITMSYDIPLLYFFLLSINMLLSGKRVMYSLSLLLLFFSGVRGCIVGVSVAFIHLFMLLRDFSPRVILYYILQYIPTITMLFLWFMYHHNETGWYLFSPNREHNEESFANIEMMVRQLLFMKWKLLDFGRVVLWLFVIGFLLKKWKQEIGFPKQLLILLVAPMILLMITMALINNPVGHKYFLTVFAVLCILACYALEHVEKAVYRNTLFVFMVIMLAGGNFWMYPQKYGNGWDSSLKVLPYFKLQDELMNYCQQNNILPNEVAADFPLSQERINTHLDAIGVDFVDGVISKNSNYFLYSNMYNPRDVKAHDELKATSTLVKSFSGGEVVVELYKMKR